MTSVRNYTDMQFVYDGKAPAQGSMCAARWSARWVGERGYTGAVLRHKSGEYICVIAGTFSHFGPLSQQFLSHVEACHKRKILCVLDTPTVERSQKSGMRTMPHGVRVLILVLVCTVISLAATIRRNGGIQTHRCTTIARFYVTEGMWRIGL